MPAQARYDRGMSSHPFNTLCLGALAGLLIGKAMYEPTKAAKAIPAPARPVLEPARAAGEDKSAPELPAFLGLACVSGKGMLRCTAGQQQEIDITCEERKGTTGVVCNRSDATKPASEWVYCELGDEFEPRCRPTELRY